MVRISVHVELTVRVSGLARRCPLCKGNWLRCGKVGSGTAKDRTVNGAQCPTVRVVKGDVIGTGESMAIDIPFERLSKTTYPRRCRSHGHINGARHDAARQAQEKGPPAGGDQP
jgi:hypothetical protein